MANDVRIDVVSFAIDDTTGTQDITANLGGNTPKLVKFFLTNSESDESITAESTLGIGASDGTNQFSISSRSRDNQASTSVRRHGNSSSCIIILNSFDFGRSFDASFNQFLSTTDTGDSTSGVRLTVNTATTGFTAQCTAVFYSGADYNGSVAVIAANGGSFDPGHNTTLCEGYTNGQAFSASLGGNFYVISQGYASFASQSVSTQHCLSTAEANGAASGQPFSLVRNDVFAIQLNAGTGNLDWSASVDVSTGTTLALTVESGSPGSDTVGIIAHNTDGLSTHVGILNTPTSTGAFSYTSPGFEPQYAGILPNGNETINASSTDEDAGFFGHCFLNNSSDSSLCVSAEDTADPTNTNCVFADKAVYVLSDDGTIEFDATRTGFQSLGIDFNFAATGATSKLWVVASIEATASGDTILEPADAAHAQTADATAFVQQNILTVADSAHAQSADVVVFVQQHVLSVADADHGQVADNATLSLAAILLVDDSSHEQVADATSFVQQHTLNVADANHEQSADQATFVVGATLSPDDTAHDQTADASSFVQQNVLALADAQHGQIADEATLITGETISPDDSAHAQESDAASFIQQNILALQDASHGQTATDSSFVQQHVFEPVDAAHGQAADNVILDTFTQLLPDNAAHGQIAVETSFVQQHILGADDAQHAQSADNATLTQQHTLVVDDAQHVQTADNVTLDLQSILDVQDASHGQIAVSSSFVQQHILDTQDAAHAQSADEIGLSVEFTLLVDDANHSQTASNIMLSLGVPVITGLGDRLMLIESESRFMVVRD